MYFMYFPTFRGKRYWVQFWDPQYGNCYTFNTRLAGHDPNTTLFTTSKPGSVYGKLALLGDSPRC